MPPRFDFAQGAVHIHSFHGTSGLVAMTSASHAEGRQFDPGLVYFSKKCMFASSWYTQPNTLHSTQTARFTHDPSAHLGTLGGFVEISKRHFAMGGIFWAATGR